MSKKKTKKKSNVQQQKTSNKVNDNIQKEEIIKIDVKKTKRSFFADTFSNNLIFVTLIVFLIEILFRAISHFEILNFATLRICISTFILTIFVTFLSSLTKRKWLRNTINLIFIFAYAFYTWLQLGFLNYLGVYISFNTSSQFGAVKDYIFDFLMSFKLVYYTIFLPFLTAVAWYLVLNRRRNYEKIKLNLKHLILFPILIISILMYYGTISLSFMQNEFQIKNNKQLFLNPDVPTVAVNQFGTTIFGILDLKSYLFPVKE